MDTKIKNDETKQENCNSTNLLKISSPNFKHNGIIPDKFTCKGLNINPTIVINNIDPNTKTLVLIIDDPDAPMGTRDHWIMRNIPITNKINENSIPDGAIQGVNSRGKNNYGGPCPPNGTHRYFFKIYALNKKLNIPTNSNKSNLEKVIQGHIIAQTEIIGLYK